VDALYASRYFRAAQPENSHRRRYGAGRLPIGSLFWLFPIQHFRRLMIRRLSVPVLLECKPDKSERHKDGSGQHHPMGVSQSNSKWSILAIAPSLVISPF
jgi:hypothetical protein